MNVLGLSITRTKAVPQQLSGVDNRGGWWPIIRESFAGAWQRNFTISPADVLTHPTVFACVTLIASDVGKMRLRLVQEDADEIWSPAESPAFTPFLRKPNRYQTRIKFIEQWIISKLVWGNAYCLKQRDQRGVVVAGYILDPARVKPLVAEDGSVYYQLYRDLLAQIDDSETPFIVPASEIMHDPMYTLYHPLVGIPPLHACGLAATLGLKIQTNSTNFFGNNSSPGGVLTAPGFIKDETAKRLKDYWDANFTGDNVGKVAVLGDGLKYEAMAITADKSQLSEQWKDASEAIASTFHCPFHLVGGPPPPYGNVQALTVQYFTQAIQSLAVQLEQVMDEGLELPKPYGTQFDIDDLLWMDSQTMMTTIGLGVGAGVLKPNEGRKKLGYKPVKGGNTPYLQQQNYSLEALDKRDAKADPFAAGTPPQPALPPAAEDDEEDDADDSMKRFSATTRRKTLEYVERQRRAA